MKQIIKKIDYVYFLMMVRMFEIAFNKTDENLSKWLMLNKPELKKKKRGQIYLII